MKDAVSVVMAVYNGSLFLRQQLDSVLSQLRPQDELIVVDDASTDDSMALLQSIGAPQLKVFSNAENLGVVATFECALRHATNDIVFLCDQDDVWLPGKRDVYVAEFERDQHVSVVISDAEVIDGEGRLMSASFMQARGGFDGTFRGTLWRNRYLGCAMALRRDALSAALPIPTSVPMHDMWLGVMGGAVGRVVYLPVPYLRYRRHGANVTSSRRHAWPQMLRWRVQLLLLFVQRCARVKLGQRHETTGGAGR